MRQNKFVQVLSISAIALGACTSKDSAKNSQPTPPPVKPLAPPPAPPVAQVKVSGVVAGEETRVGGAVAMVASAGPGTSVKRIYLLLIKEGRNVSCAEFEQNTDAVVAEIDADLEPGKAITIAEARQTENSPPQQGQPVQPAEPTTEPTTDQGETPADGANDIRGAAAPAQENDNDLEIPAGVPLANGEGNGYFFRGNTDPENAVKGFLFLQSANDTELSGRLGIKGSGAKGASKLVGNFVAQVCPATANVAGQGETEETEREPAQGQKPKN